MFFLSLLLDPKPINEYSIIQVFCNYLIFEFCFKSNENENEEYNEIEHIQNDVDSSV